MCPVSGAASNSYRRYLAAIERAQLADDPQRKAIVYFCEIFMSLKKVIQRKESGSRSTRPCRPDGAPKRRGEFAWDCPLHPDDKSGICLRKRILRNRLQILSSQVETWRRTGTLDIRVSTEWLSAIYVPPYVARRGLRFLFSIQECFGFTAMSDFPGITYR